MCVYVCVCVCVCVCVRVYVCYRDGACLCPLSAVCEEEKEDYRPASLRCAPGCMPAAQSQTAHRLATGTFRLCRNHPLQSFRQRRWSSTLTSPGCFGGSGEAWRGASRRRPLPTTAWALVSTAQSIATIRKAGHIPDGIRQS